MRITLKLFASLASYLPAEAKENALKIEIEQATTPNQLIARFQLPAKEVHLVLKNGVFLPPAKRDEPLANDDVLAMWPPVAGG